MRIVRDGFVWLGVTDKAKEVYASGMFELYTLHEDGSESLIQSDNDLNEALENGLDIGIEVGHEVDKLRLMYGFVTEFAKDLRDAYESIPEEQRLITYEQFIVAQFSNLIEDEII